MRLSAFATLGLFLAQSASAQVVATAAPPIESQGIGIGSGVLPANSELTVSLNSEISTKGSRWNEGDTFYLTVSRAVRVGKHTVIPRGARAVGRITWLTSKGAFGKSGKMEFDVEYIELGGERFPLVGQFRQEGEGNTVATVGTAIAAGVFAGLVTGRSATIPAGRELVVRTKDDIPFVFEVANAQAGGNISPMLEAGTVRATSPSPVPQTSAPVTAPRRAGNSRIRCVTC